MRNSEIPPATSPARDLRASEGWQWQLDRTRRAWVAPARDGRYVLGQLRSRTAGVSFLSFWDGVCRHNWNDQKIEKSRLF